MHNSIVEALGMMDNLTQKPETVRDHKFSIKYRFSHLILFTKRCENEIKKQKREIERIYSKLANLLDTQDLRGQLKTHIDVNQFSKLESELKKIKWTIELLLRVKKQERQFSIPEIFIEKEKITNFLKENTKRISFPISDTSFSLTMLRNLLAIEGVTYSTMSNRVDLYNNSKIGFTQFLSFSSRASESTDKVLALLKREYNAEMLNQFERVNRALDLQDAVLEILTKNRLNGC